MADTLISLGPELAGIVIGVLAIDTLIEWRQNEQLKAQLIREMGSADNGIARRAVRELDDRRWLYNDPLENAYLVGANQNGAFLNGANLKGALLADADLKGADLVEADLREADLECADLRGADILGAKLEKAHLGGTKLEKAKLVNADLRDAYLGGFTYGRDSQGQEYVVFPSNSDLRKADL